MSKRPREEKKLNKLRKAMRRTPPSYIDLVEWLKIRRYAQTTGEALKLMTDGRVRVGSHIVGRFEADEEFYPLRLIPATQKDEIIVLEKS